MVEKNRSYSSSFNVRPLTVMVGGALLPYLAGTALVMGLKDQIANGVNFVDPVAFFTWFPWIQSAALLIMLIWTVMMMKKDHLNVVEVGFRSTSIPLDLGLGLLAGGVLWIVMSLTYRSVSFLPFNVLTGFPSGMPPLPTLVYLLLATLSGELLYRGYGMTSLRERSGALWALLVTSLLTAAWAWVGSWQGVAVWLIMGLLLGVMSILRGGSIVCGMIARLTATILLWAASDFFAIFG